MQQTCNDAVRTLASPHGGVPEGRCFFLTMVEADAIVPYEAPEHEDALPDHDGNVYGARGSFLAKYSSRLRRVNTFQGAVPLSPGETFKLKVVEVGSFGEIAIGLSSTRGQASVDSYAEVDMVGWSRGEALGDAAHGNALKAWFRILDTEQNMKVTFRRFKTQLSRLQKLQEEDSSAQVWRAWDPDCTGYLFLRRFHPDSHEAAARLKRWAAKYGGVVKFISQLESLHGRVTKVTFRKALVDVLEHPATDLLFEGLDVGDTGHLGEQDVRFLDRWDLALEDELHGAEAPGSP